MTLAGLKKKYEVHEFRHDKNKFLLFDKTPATTGRSVHKYLCLVSKKDNTFQVEGFEPTEKVSTLRKNVEKYTKSLPYDSDYYNPHWRIGLKEEMIIHDYMRSLGFDSHGDEFYELKQANIYGYASQKIKISLWGISCWGNSYASWDDRNKLSKTVRILLHTGEMSWIESEVNRDVEEVKKGIDSILKPLLLTEGINNIKKSETLKNVGDIDVAMKSLTESFDIGSKDFKKHLKKQLQETLAKLG